MDVDKTQDEYDLDDIDAAFQLGRKAFTRANFYRDAVGACQIMGEMVRKIDEIEGRRLSEKNQQIMRSVYKERDEALMMMDMLAAQNMNEREPNIKSVAYVPGAMARRFCDRMVNSKRKADANDSERWELPLPRRRCLGEKCPYAN